MEGKICYLENYKEEFVCVCINELVSKLNDLIINYEFC